MANGFGQSQGELLHLISKSTWGNFVSVQRNKRD